MKRLGTLVATLAMGACFLSTEPADGLLLSMELNTTHVRSDSALFVVLTVRNPTTRGIPYDRNCQLLSVAVFAPDSTPRTGQACAQALIGSFAIPPGGIVSDTFGMNFGYGGPNSDHRWTPGPYRVRGVLWGLNHQAVQSVDSSFTLACSDPAWTEC